jgi:hypothetical protein
MYAFITRRTCIPNAPPDSVSVPDAPPRRVCVPDALVRIRRVLYPEKVWIPLVALNALNALNARIFFS